MNNNRKAKLNNEELDAFNYMFGGEITVRDNPNYVHKCYVCGKPLTQEDSILHGTGKKCRENHVTNLLQRRMNQFDEQLFQAEKNIDILNEKEYDEILDGYISKKVNFLLDLVNDLNVKFSKTRDANVKKTKKIVLNYASMVLNNIWDNDDESLIEDRSFLILSRSVQWEDKEILKYTVPNTNF